MKNDRKIEQDLINENLANLIQYMSIYNNNDK